MPDPNTGRPQLAVAGAVAGRDPMERALQLARCADHRQGPNPMVGAVLVADGRVVGEGFHQRAGGPHAEVVALEAAGERARGAALYVTLEPCAHAGRTGPCVDRLVAAGVTAVHVATRDPNPLVDGRGVAALRAAGIPVTEGAHAAEARRLIAPFATWITTGLPFVTLKFAMTLDGKLATVAGESRWITGPEARSAAHELRHQHDAVLVGSGTVLADDPLLTARLPDRVGRQPQRVVADGRLRVPPTAQALRAEAAPPVVLTVRAAPADRRAALEAAGVDVLTCAESDGHPDLRDGLAQLAARGVTSCLLEGGSTLLGAALVAGLVNRVVAFVAPILVGGSAAPDAIGGQGIGRLEAALRLREWTVERYGADLCITGEV